MEKLEQKSTDTRWRNVVINGFITNYSVKDDGTVYNKKTENYMGIGDNGNGYKNTQLSVGGTIVKRYIHRLVAEHFLPNPDNLPQVNHIDCNKENNHVSNLEWISSKNILHAHAEGRMRKRSELVTIKHLTIDQVKDLYLSVKRDKVGISEKARQMGIARTTASSIMNKRSRQDITDVLDEQLALTN